MLLSVLWGMDGGLSQPVLGCEDLQNGPVLGLFMLTRTAILDHGLALSARYHRGDNPGYAVELYGLRYVVGKTAWQCSPHFEIGADRLNRHADTGGESGYAAGYLLGVDYNIHADYLTISPGLSFAGMLDGAGHAGFLGFHVRVSYGR